jgi:hypothetical protein
MSVVVGVLLTQASALCYALGLCTQRYALQVRPAVLMRPLAQFARACNLRERAWVGTGPSGTTYG